MPHIPLILLAKCPITSKNHTQGGPEKVSHFLIFIKSYRNSLLRLEVALKFERRRIRLLSAGIKYSMYELILTSSITVSEAALWPDVMDVIKS